MFKNERRFEYNINPQLPADCDGASGKYPVRNGVEYPSGNSTPLNKKYMGNMPLEGRERHQTSIQEPQNYPLQRNEEHF
jgi:hypothetical protein